VTTAEGEALAKKLHAGFIESSAKNNENVGECSAAHSEARMLEPATGCPTGNPSSL
jgi:hypothetical protein